jgi:hypothetical protein
VALNIDTSRPLRTQRQLGDLLTAIDGANASDESYSVEWKSALDLRKAAGHFSVAKCILGMGNRPVRKSLPMFEGCAYMVVGMEPGSVVGVDVPDYADLQPWIETYTGTDGPDWSPQQVTYKGVTVLVITIESPRDGDQAHPLRKTYSPPPKTADGKKPPRGYSEGTLFVRHLAKSEPASTADIRELEQRLLAGRSGVEAFDNLTADSLGAVRVLNFTQESEDARYAQEEKAMPQLETDTAGSRPGLYGTAVPAFNLHRPEERDRYERERQKYLRDFKAALRPYALDIAGRRHKAPFAVQITNDSNTILTDLQICVELPDNLHAFLTPGDNPVELPKPPKRPSSLIPAILAATYGGAFRPPDMSGMFDRFYFANDRRSVTFSITNVHPHRTEMTDSILLFTKLSTVGVGNIAGARWDLPVSITAANRSGQWQGTIAVSAVVTVLAEENLLPPVVA